jgi:hypothetical protein
MKIRLQWVGALLLIGAVIGCGKRSTEVSAAARGAATPAPRSSGLAAPQGPSQTSAGTEPPTLFPYPPARWRLVSFEELDRVTLWVGQIAIRHEKSRSEGLRAANWQPDGPNPSRTVAAAVALAEQLHAQLLRAPDEFEALARKYSDDVETKDLGGYLGGMRAGQLSAADFLDVLAALKPGEVSKPFQTPYGVHIIKRYAPPPSEQVAGERIVIGYEGVFGLGREAQRSRAEALALAQEVAARAKQNPDGFRALVAQYSDNVDRSIHGEMGVYSTRDPGYLPLEVDGLSRTKVGEIYGPIDGRQGFQILRRVPVVPQKEYAMTAIEVMLDTRLPDEATALNQARTELAKIQQILAADPSRFQELQRLHHSETVRRWAYAQGDLGLTLQLDKLATGQIAREPVRFGRALVLMKRLDPKELPPEPARLTELPNPSDPDYDALIGYNNGTQLAAAARAFVGELRAKSAGLEPKAVDLVATTFDKLGSYLDQNAADSASARTTIHAAFASLERELDAETYRKLLDAGRKWVIRQMMPDVEAAEGPGARSD